MVGWLAVEFEFEFRVSIFIANNTFNVMDIEIQKLIIIKKMSWAV